MLNLIKKYSKKESKFETKEKNQSSKDVGSLQRTQGSVDTINNGFIGSSLWKPTHWGDHIFEKYNPSQY